MDYKKQQHLYYIRILIGLKHGQYTIKHHRTQVMVQVMFNILVSMVLELLIILEVLMIKLTH